MHVFPWSSETQVIPVQRKETKWNSKVSGYITSPFLTWLEDNIWKVTELFRISIDELQEYVEAKSGRQKHKVRCKQGQQGNKLSLYKYI